MKSMRIPLIVATGITLLGMILGFFFDLKISQAIATPGTGFGLAFSVVAPTLGFCGLAALGGAIFKIGLDKKDSKGIKITCLIVGILAVGVSIYFGGQEFFGENGYYKAAPMIVGYLIAAIVHAGAFVGGFFLAKNNKNDKAWIYILVAMGVAFIALVAFTTGLKAIFHRPRYRLLVAQNDTSLFYRLFARCGNYKELMTQYGVTSEEFKSFPSGHTCEASVLIIFVVFMPFFNEKLTKLQLPCFVVAFAIVILTGLSRILAGAHYLSDVSTGAFVTLLTLLVANEILPHIKSLQPKPVEAAE